MRFANARLRASLFVALLSITVSVGPPLLPAAQAIVPFAGQWRTLPYSMPINPIRTVRAARPTISSALGVGGAPATSRSAIPGRVVFARPGTYVVSLTVVDDRGVNDPSPPTVTVTVRP